MTGYPPVVGWSASITTGWPSWGHLDRARYQPLARQLVVIQAPYRRTREAQPDPAHGLDRPRTRRQLRRCRAVEPTGPWAGPHPEAIGPRRGRRDVDEDRGRRVVADGQQHSRPDRGRPETRQRVVRPRPEHRRDRESPAHGQVRPRAFDVHGDRQLLPRRQGARCQVGGRRHENRTCGTHHEPAGSLEHRGTLVVADQPVDERGERRIDSARGRHAEMGEARSALILDRRRPTDVDDLDRSTRHVATNLTSVPGSSNAGGSRSASQTRVDVVPSRCHPPGDTPG